MAKPKFDTLFNMVTEGKDVSSAVSIINYAQSTPILNYNWRGAGRWIWYDFDNLLPQRLLNLYFTAPTHSSIIEKKIEKIVGESVSWNDPKIDQWFEKNGICFEELYQQLARQLLIFGGFSLQAFWNEKGDLLRKIDIQDFSQVRIAKSLESYWVCADWFYYQRYKPIEFDKWNPYASDKKQVQIFYYKTVLPSIWYYALPDYFAGVAFIKAENELGQFDYQNVKNAFLPSSILKIPEKIAPEVRSEMERQILEKFGGTDNAGKLMIVYADGDKVVEVIPLNNKQNDGIFKDQNERLVQKIITAHRVPSPVLVGLPGAGSLGGNSSEIATATAEFLTIIKSYQKTINNQLEKLMYFAGFSNPQIVNVQSKSSNYLIAEYLLEMQQAGILSTNEVRIELGYVPIELPEDEAPINPNNPSPSVETPTASKDPNVPVEANSNGGNKILKGIKKIFKK